MYNSNSAFMLEVDLNFFIIMFRLTVLQKSYEICWKEKHGYLVFKARFW